MPDYKEIKREIDVPLNTGIDGFLKSIEAVLKLSKVQEVTIRSNGKLEYRRLLRSDEEEDELRIDLSTLMPFAVIRNNPLEEITPIPKANAAVVMSQLFAAASRDGLNPIALVGGPSSHFWEWHGRSTTVALRREEAYGLPFLQDNRIPDEALILCAAYSRAAKLIDTRRSYKVLMSF